MGNDNLEKTGGRKVRMKNEGESGEATMSFRQ